MTTRPTRIVQTSNEAKKEYKKNGPRLPGRQQRQLERAVELDTRAARLRGQEERKQMAKKRRDDRERKEREARKQLGVGLATQMVGYSHTQARLKSGMEAFVGLKKREEESKRKELEVRKKLEAIAEAMEKEPWDDSDGEDVVADLPGLDTTIEGDQWIDDDLDDDTLLEAHDLVMSDTIEDLLAPPPGPLPPPPASIPEAKKPAIRKEDSEFLRLHGPINKAIEERLESLPEPLIELLSQDTSTNLTWNPAPSLLHKLNPVGLPPHRLRLKVGCVVSLLRELNSSSQLSKSSHLRVVRVEKDWLECFVLDGQLEGTKVFLTRIPFPANYRNENQLSFQRTQFPIRVSTDVTHLHEAREIPQSAFKLPSFPGQPPRPPSSFNRPVIPASKMRTKTNLNPSFKLPGLPASKSTRPPAPQKPVAPAVSVLLDGWDDFLDSGTQIARELCSENSHTQHKPELDASALVPLSTQDLDFTLEDLEDILEEPKPPNASVQVMPEKTIPPRKEPYKPPPNALPKPSPLSTKKSPMKPSVAPPPPRPRQQPTLKRKVPPTPAAKPPPKRSADQPRKTSIVPNVVFKTTSFGSLSELGLSTQEAVSFFDDDDEDMTFSSPPIAV